jgi:tetratricopeptide (TPR) repeat protein
MPALEKAGRFDEGISICRRALLIDPYSEKIHQYLMRFLLSQDNRQEVIKVYEDLSKLLMSTFNVLPSQESRELYHEALSSMQNVTTVSPEMLLSQLGEQGQINGAVICDYVFFQKLYQAQARTVMRSGTVIHTVLLTLKNHRSKNVSQRSLSLAMDNLEKHMSLSLRKGDVITRCSASQFILMLHSANYENSCMVCRRFISSFEKKYPHSPVYVDFFVQPMVPSTDA